MAYQKVVVAGGGVLGSQIGLQAAFHGYDVTMWLRSEDSIKRNDPKMERYHQLHIADLEAAKQALGKPGAPYPRGLILDYKNATPESIDALIQQAKDSYEKIQYTTDLEAAVKDADLVIEAIAEIPNAKVEFYQDLAKVLPEKTIIATNTSTLLPSMFAEVTGRPEKYLALHFANTIWKNNTAEVMGHAGTGQEAYDQVVDFAEKIGMVALQLKKEQPGYILNTLLVPFLSAAEVLLVKGVADVETIDKTWMLATGAPFGPFRILDVVGLETAYNIVMMKPEAKSDPESIPAQIGAMLKTYIDAGKTGINAGEGFYKYR